MTTEITSAIETAGSPYPLTHPALKGFDDLPDSAFIPLPVVCALFSCSPATAWRRVRSGQLIPPHRIGKRTTRWSVREIRDALTKIRNEKN